MIAALRGDDDAARRHALLALESGAAPLSREICEELVALLADERKDVNRRAAGALARAAADPVYAPLLERALADAHPRRRWCAAFALSRAGRVDEAVFDAALDAMGSDDGDVRWAAAEIVIAGVRAHAARPPRDGEPADRRARLQVAARSSVAALRKMALYCLRDLDVADSSPFVTALDDPDRGVRLAALSGLARCASMASATAEKVLTVASTDADDGVRRAAVATLARRRDVDSSVRERLRRTAAASGARDVLRATTGAGNEDGKE